VFAGMDLAYTGDRPYCRGTTWERDWALAEQATGMSLAQIWREDLDRKPLTPCDAVDGSRVQTTPTLLAFRDWLVEATSARPERSFLNLTGAGVLSGPRIRQVGPDALDRLPTARQDASWTLRLSDAWRRGRTEPTRRHTALTALTGSAPGDGDASPWQTWIDVLGSADDAVDAWSSLAEATSMPPSASVEAGCRLAEALIARADYRRALRVLSWVECWRATPRTRYLRGFGLQMSGGDPLAALACYAGAMSDIQCRFWAGAQRAVLLADLGRPAAAADALAEALRGRSTLSPAAATLVEAIRQRLADHDAVGQAAAGERA
jgi:hypothetical protein